ncbi:hypothetical protein CASFOL_041408 [Castilleja foliolosa]|uniref:F-box domain-containing protein n=1 Tax=Castilleja foliolosa TaxID=1961234 RepID=A0ABD3BC25_9LAMI
MSQKRYRKTIESSTGDAMADCVLPEDLMLCIFTRLPVKSIHCFKSVCKPLRDVLSSPEFAKIHRAQFALNPENQSVITRERITKSDRTIWSISMLKIDSERKPIPFPQVYNFAEEFEIIGCCNGLICMDFLLGNGKRRLALWNPALNNMSVSLPDPEMEIVHPSLVSLGFGYNEEADDFKVIKIAELRNNNKKMSVAVYSSNSNSWSKIDVGFHFAADQSTNCTIVNGSPYWEASVYYGKRVWCVLMLEKWCSRSYLGRTLWGLEMEICYLWIGRVILVLSCVVWRKTRRFCRLMFGFLMTLGKLGGPRNIVLDRTG